MTLKQSVRKVKPEENRAAASSERIDRLISNVMNQIEESERPMAPQPPVTAPSPMMMLFFAVPIIFSAGLGLVLGPIIFDGAAPQTFAQSLLGSTF